MGNGNKALFSMVLISLIITPIQAGTLSRGVTLSPFFAAGPPNHGAIASLMYRMAVDEELGIERTWVQHYYSYVSYATSFEGGASQVNVNASLEEGEVGISTYNDSSTDFADGATQINVAAKVQLGSVSIIGNDN